MTNEDGFRTTSVLFLDTIGGENVIGSGFEEEIPDPEFSPAAHS